MRHGQAKECLRFYGHGKIVLSGEYFVLDGANAIGLPTTVGQELQISYRKSFNSWLYWESYTYQKELWFSAKFDLWGLKILETNNEIVAKRLQDLLRAARHQNDHFLRTESEEIYARSYFDYPMEWGLGSSSTLIYNISQWAYISPYQLFTETSLGSGLDLACAQAQSPILYKLNKEGPEWEFTKLHKSLFPYLFFIYLGHKVETLASIQKYFKIEGDKSEIIKKISELTHKMIQAKNLESFEKVVREHEKIVGNFLGKTPIKEEKFSDYWGEIKSLGSWGGDFALVTSERGMGETASYFQEKRIQVVIPYEELIFFGEGKEEKKC